MFVPVLKGADYSVKIILISVSVNLHLCALMAVTVTLEPTLILFENGFTPLLSIPLFIYLYAED